MVGCVQCSSVGQPVRRTAAPWQAKESRSEADAVRTCHPSCRPQTVPVVVGGPETNGTCPPAPAGALPTQPDSVDETSQLCDADWQQALVRRCWCRAGCMPAAAVTLAMLCHGRERQLGPGGNFCKALPQAPTPICLQADAKALFPAFNCGNNTEAGQALAQLVAQAAGDARRQALLFRAFLMQFCAGGFYSPFSGDGLT